jgi:hypothetical protein
VSRRPPHLQGHHFDHGAKVTAFAAARASTAERVEDVGYLFREGLGDVEAVATDVEEGAAVAEAVLEASQVVADTFEGAKPPDEARGDPLAGDPGRNLTPIIAACCPTVGANCRGNLETVAKGMAYRRGSTVCDDGSGSGLCE